MSGLRAFVRLIGPDRWRFAAAVACGLTSQLATVGIAAMTGALAGAALSGDPTAALSGEPTAVLGPLAIAAAVLLLPRAVLPWFETLLAHDVAFRVLARVRDAVHNAVATLTPAGLALRRTGDLAATAVGDVEVLELFFAHTLGPLLVALVVPASAIVVLAVLAPLLLLVLLPLLLALAAVPALLRRHAADDGRKVQEALAGISIALVDTVQGLREVVLFDAQPARRAATAAAQDRSRLAHHTQARRNGRYLSTLDAVLGLGLLAVLAAAGGAARAGGLALADLPVVLLVVAFALAPVSTVMTVARELNVCLAAARRVTALLDLAAAVPVCAGVEALLTTPSRVELRGVRFGYAPDRPVLDGLDLTVRPGETVAVLGPSGVGKSSLAALLVRFWTPQHGTITLDGHPLGDLAEHVLRGAVGYVPQQVYLFADTVAANIRLARSGASDDEVRRAAQDALAHDLITALPEGYDTLLGERGHTLSGGQRQRIALARALLADPPVLVLDEPTSALDTDTEAELLPRLLARRRDRTTVIITHRASAASVADRIVVLAGGRIVEDGDHTSLLALDGEYRRLLATQLELTATQGTADS